MENQNVFTEVKVAEIELSYKPKVKPSEMFQILRPVDAYNILIQTWDKSKIDFVEQFIIVLLNRANKVIGICTISTGNVSGTIADPKLIFAVAMKTNASGIIIAHNHPSGNLKPSANDCDLTYKIREGGKLLDIMLKDHMIVTSEGYYSFADEGAL